MFPSSYTPYLQGPNASYSKANEKEGLLLLEGSVLTSQQICLQFQNKFMPTVSELFPGIMCFHRKTTNNEHVHPPSHRLSKRKPNNWYWISNRIWQRENRCATRVIVIFFSDGTLKPFGQYKMKYVNYDFWVRISHQGPVFTRQICSVSFTGCYRNSFWLVSWSNDTPVQPASYQRSIPSHFQLPFV